MNTSAKSVLRLRAGGAAVLAALCLIAGCGQSNNATTVSGKVTYRSEPLNGGTIKLYPDVTPTAGGGDNSFLVAIKPDGTFTASNVPPGMKTVTIETQPPQIRGVANSPKIDPTTHLPVGMKPPPDFDPNQVKSSPGTAAPPSPDLTVIPLKYANPRTSGLTWDVKPGPQKKDFDLTD